MIILSAKQGVLETLYRAAHEPIGLRIPIKGASLKTVRQWFYNTMRKHSPEFDHLVLVNMDDELWIVRKDADVSTK